MCTGIYGLTTDGYSYLQLTLKMMSKVLKIDIGTYLLLRKCYRLLLYFIITVKVMGQRYMVVQLVCIAI